jgi:hypothetical protein
MESQGPESPHPELFTLKVRAFLREINTWPDIAKGGRYDEKKLTALI